MNNSAQRKCLRSLLILVIDDEIAPEAASTLRRRFAAGQVRLGWIGSRCRQQIECGEQPPLTSPIVVEGVSCDISTMQVHTIIARLKNGMPDLTEDPTPILPPAFFQCDRLWKDRGRRKSWPKDQWAFVRRTVEPLLYARIKPQSEHRENGLVHPGKAIPEQAIELISGASKTARSPSYRPMRSSR